MVDESLKSYIETNILPLYDDFLTALLANFAPIINHIGSTAIPGIMAKRICRYSCGDFNSDVPDDKIRELVGQSYEIVKAE